MKMSIKSKHKTIITVVAVLCATLFLTHEHILQAVGSFLVVQDKLQSGDVIHVIAGPDYRTDYGIHLYKQGHGKLIFFSGGWCTLHKEKHGRRAKQRAFAQAIPSEAIAIDDSKVMSTYAEVLRLKKFMARSQIPIRSIIVVSDPYHMWRARWTYRQVMGDEIGLEMAPVPFELSPHQSQWWKHEMSRQHVMNEYLKIAYYITRYQLSFGPITKWLASLDQY
jgi:uncharacterized SAM-binding protein YcdF (DUF218 family)